MVVVENTFNQPKFAAGKIYFLNTQKFSKNSLLVRGFDIDAAEAKAGGFLPDMRPDARAYTIWDTIQNTIEDPDLTLYLVLDEAHRGLGSATTASLNAKSTIVQRLINGVNRVPGIPVVWGISATVERFNEAMKVSVGRALLPNVLVDPAKVQESGLIKDTILIDIPDEKGDFSTVLVRRAADKLRTSTETWAEYAKRQDDAQTVVPLMVLQVKNKADPDEVGRALETIYKEWPQLPSGSVANMRPSSSAITPCLISRWRTYKVRPGFECCWRKMPSVRDGIVRELRSCCPFVPPMTECMVFGSEKQ